jgi:hypothetical protein
MLKKLKLLTFYFLIYASVFLLVFIVSLNQFKFFNAEGTNPCYKTVTVKHEIVILLNVKREKYEILILFYFDFFSH